jgi:hypothetical protein
MATKTPSGYPHVGQIHDVPTASTIRLIWDQLRNHNTEVAATQATLATIQSQLATLNTTANNALLLAKQAGAVTVSTVAGIAVGTGGQPNPEPPLPYTPDAASPIDIGSVTILPASAPNVFAFDKAASLDAFGIQPGIMTISSTGTDAWPAVSIDGGPPSQSATLWVLLFISGAWYAAGAERLRPTQVNGTKPEGSPTDVIGRGWLYDGSRWGIMAGYEPYPGQKVGVMLVAGDTRAPGNQTPVMQRTPVVEINWPAAEGANPCNVLWIES